MGKTALVFLAEGAEEMETVITVDVLRRGGIDVTLAGLTDNASTPIVCSREVKIVPDKTLDQALKDKYDVLVMPGGGQGVKNLRANEQVGKALKEQEGRGCLVAAVCAAPIALAAHGIGKGKRITCYPGMEEKLKELAPQGGYHHVEDRVVKDGQLITSRGPGTCFEFALKIVEDLCGREKADAVKKGLLLKE